MEDAGEGNAVKDSSSTSLFLARPELPAKMLTPPIHPPSKPAGMPFRMLDLRNRRDFDEGQRG
jgi:hypothetical protein